MSQPGGVKQCDEVVAQTAGGADDGNVVYGHLVGKFDCRVGRRLVWQYGASFSTFLVGGGNWRRLWNTFDGIEMADPKALLRRQVTGGGFSWRGEFRAVKSPYAREPLPTVFPFIAMAKAAGRFERADLELGRLGDGF